MFSCRNVTHSPESYDKADVDPRNGRPLDVGTHGLETAGNAKQSDNFFEKALLKAQESDHVAKGNVPEVKAVGNAHSHGIGPHPIVPVVAANGSIPVTDNCRRVKGVWLCFGGGGYDFQHNALRNTNNSLKVLFCIWQDRVCSVILDISNCQY